MNEINDTIEELSNKRVLHLGEMSASSVPNAIDDATENSSEMEISDDSSDDGSSDCSSSPSESIGATELLDPSIASVDINVGVPVHNQIYKPSTVHVHSIAPEVTEENIYELFTQIGPVRSIKIIGSVSTTKVDKFDAGSGSKSGHGTGPNDGETSGPQGRDSSRRFVFVEFVHEISAMYCIRVLQGVKLYGQPLNLSLSGFHELRHIAKGDVYVRNLADEVDENAIIDLFSIAVDPPKCKKIMIPSTRAIRNNNKLTSTRPSAMALRLLSKSATETDETKVNDTAMHTSANNVSKAMDTEGPHITSSSKSSIATDVSTSKSITALEKKVQDHHPSYVESEEDLYYVPSVVPNNEGESNAHNVPLSDAVATTAMETGEAKPDAVDQSEEEEELEPGEIIRTVVPVLVNSDDTTGESKAISPPSQLSLTKESAKSIPGFGTPLAQQSESTIAVSDEQIVPEEAEVEDGEVAPSPKESPRILYKYEQPGFFGVLDVNIQRDKVTKQSKGFGFVRLRTRKEAERAVELLNGVYLCGKRIWVQLAKSMFREDRESEDPHNEDEIAETRREGNEFPDANVTGDAVEQQARVIEEVFPRMPYTLKRRKTPFSGQDKTHPNLHEVDDWVRTKILQQAPILEYTEELDLALRREAVEAALDAINRRLLGKDAIAATNRYPYRSRGFRSSGPMSSPSERDYPQRGHYSRSKYESYNPSPQNAPFYSNRPYERQGLPPPPAHGPYVRTEGPGHVVPPRQPPLLPSSSLSQLHSAPTPPPVPAGPVRSDGFFTVQASASTSSSFPPPRQEPPLPAEAEAFQRQGQQPYKRQRGQFASDVMDGHYPRQPPYPAHSYAPSVTRSYETVEKQDRSYANLYSDPSDHAPSYGGGEFRHEQGPQAAYDRPDMTAHSYHQRHAPHHGDAFESSPYFSQRSHNSYSERRHWSQKDEHSDSSATQPYSQSFSQDSGYYGTQDSIRSTKSTHVYDRSQSGRRSKGAYVDPFYYPHGKEEGVSAHHPPRHWSQDSQTTPRGSSDPYYVLPSSHPAPHHGSQPPYSYNR